MLIKKINLGCRKSKLALWQASHVKQLLNNLNPDLEINIVSMNTSGDLNLNQALADIGGKGLFIKELELALSNKIIDVAVHCLKDMPTTIDKKFHLACYLPRADPRDAFLSLYCDNIAQLGVGAIVGTSSPRRQAIINKFYPHLIVKPLRGNVDTRIKSLTQGLYDAIVLASAGLIRLDLDSKIKQKLDLEQFIPAVGQGIITLECLSVDHQLRELLVQLNSWNSQSCATTERMVGNYLHASCTTPFGCYAQIEQQKIYIAAMMADSSNKKYINLNLEGDVSDYQELAYQMAINLIK